MRTKRNTKIPNKFEDFIHSINNSKTNKKIASKKIDVSKKNLDVLGNGTEKDKESIGSKGSYRDDCVVTTDEREKSDARSKDVLENIAGMDGTTGIEETAEKVQSGSNSVNELANDEIVESSDNDKGKSNGGQVKNCQKEVNVTLKTYAHIVKHDDLPKNLNYVPTLITESGNEVVIFDEVLVNKGSERWNLTLCGQFVGFDMNIRELRDSNGLNAVLDKAWSVEGISAIASSLGRAVMMDTNTAAMCHKGIGNFDFARVLVEMDAKKELKKEIMIQYRDKNNNVKGSKTAKGNRNGPNSHWQHNGNVRGRATDGRRQEYRKRQMDAENLNKEGNGNKVKHSKWC
ncbi:hypothetical protein Tco_0174419 [Tanacetum coccineum]